MTTTPPPNMHNLPIGTRVKDKPCAGGRTGYEYCGVIEKVKWWTMIRAVDPVTGTRKGCYDEKVFAGRDGYADARIYSDTFYPDGAQFPDGLDLSSMFKDPPAVWEGGDRVVKAVVLRTLVCYDIRYNNGRRYRGCGESGIVLDESDLPIGTRVINNVKNRTDSFAGVIMRKSWKTELLACQEYVGRRSSRRSGRSANALDIAAYVGDTGSSDGTIMCDVRHEIGTSIPLDLNSIYQVKLIWDGDWKDESRVVPAIVNGTYVRYTIRCDNGQTITDVGEGEVVVA